jgi:hypothetical protein
MDGWIGWDRSRWGKTRQKKQNTQVRQQQALVAQDGLVVDDDGGRGFRRFRERIPARIVIVVAIITHASRAGLGEGRRRVFVSGVVTVSAAVCRRRRCCGGGGGGDGGCCCCPPSLPPCPPPLGLGLQVAVLFLF